MEEATVNFLWFHEFLRIFGWQILFNGHLESERKL